jgi:hypothetical protein
LALDWLSEMLTSELAAGEKLLTIPEKTWLG